MIKQIVKFLLALGLTAVVGLILTTGLGYIQAQWTNATMELARHNMGNLVSLRANANMWGLIYWAVATIGVALIIGFWALLYRKQLKSLKTMFLSVLLLFLLAGCIPTDRVVLITPPNYGIVVSLSDTTDQATGNNFDQGQLLNVTEQSITLTRCAVNSPDMCPDKIVIEVQGSPESRLYTKSANSGTSVSNQALCFEAKGANGCVDFSLSAIIERNDVKCYANKMGVKPSTIADDAKFHFFATPLTEVLDTRVIQVASAQFNKSVATVSPLELALKKFDLFDGVKQSIMDEVHNQTCVTLTNLAISNGITWDQPEIQDQINQATILANQLILVDQQNQLLAKQNDAFIARALEMEKQFGLEAAVRFMQVQKWDGSYLPVLPGTPALSPTALPSTTQPAATSTPLPTPTATP